MQLREADYSAPRPLMLLMKGHPASGKSSLARQLARQTGFALSDKDDSRNCFHALELAGQQGFPDLNNLSYAIMLRVAGTQLSCGNSVICDGPLSRLATYQQAAVLADEHRANVVVVECMPADQAVWQQRLEARAALEAAADSSHKPKTWQQLEALIARYEGQDQWATNGSISLEHFLQLDTGQGSLEDQAAAVLQFLTQRDLM
eukprot:jgi/Astpho2/9039/Aster-x0840